MVVVVNAKGRGLLRDPRRVTTSIFVPKRQRDTQPSDACAFHQHHLGLMSQGASASPMPPPSVADKFLQLFRVFRAQSQVVHIVYLFYNTVKHQIKSQVLSWKFCSSRP